MTPTSRTAASSPARTRPAAVGDAGVSEIISACSSTSRAVTQAGRGHEHVAAAGGEEVGDVGAARATQERGHALLQEHPLDHLGLGLVGRADDADELAPR